MLDYARVMNPSYAHVLLTLPSRMKSSVTDRELPVHSLTVNHLMEASSSTAHIYPRRPNMLDILNRYRASSTPSLGTRMSLFPFQAIALQRSHPGHDRLPLQLQACPLAPPNTPAPLLILTLHITKLLSRLTELPQLMPDHRFCNQHIIINLPIMHLKLQPDEVRQYCCCPGFGFDGTEFNAGGTVCGDFEAESLRWGSEA